MSTTWIGPLDGLRPIRSPAPVPEVQVDRPMAEVRTLGGLRKVQRAPRAMRSYSWSLNLARPDEIAALVAMEQGLLGSVLYLYDEWAARWNMLGPGAASPGLGGDEPWFADVGATIAYGTVVTAAGITYTITVDDAPALLPTIPVITGRTYTAAVETDADAELELRWFNPGGGSSTSTSGVGTGRLVLTAAAPALATGVQVRLSPVTTATFSEVQLIQGDAAVDWLPGQGIPRVVLSGLAQGLRVGWRRDLAVTLLEVG